MFMKYSAFVMTAIFKLIMLQAFELLLDDEHKLVLHGLQQYYVNVTEDLKTRKLIEYLDEIEFNQVIIFVSKVFNNE